MSERLKPAWSSQHSCLHSVSSETLSSLHSSSLGWGPNPKLSFSLRQSHSVPLLGLQIHVDQTVFLTELTENCLPQLPRINSVCYPTWPTNSLITSVLSLASQTSGWCLESLLSHLLCGPYWDVVCYGKASWGTDAVISVYSRHLMATWPSSFCLLLQTLDSLSVQFSPNLLVDFGLKPRGLSDIRN